MVLYKHASCPILLPLTALGGQMTDCNHVLLVLKISVFQVEGTDFQILNNLFILML